MFQGKIKTKEKMFFSFFFFKKVSNILVRGIYKRSCHCECEKMSRSSSDAKFVTIIPSELMRGNIFQRDESESAALTVLSAGLTRPSDAGLPTVTTTFICHSCQDTSRDKQDHYAIISAM